MGKKKMQNDLISIQLWSVHFGLRESNCDRRYLVRTAALNLSLS